MPYTLDHIRKSYPKTTLVGIEEYSGPYGIPITYKMYKCPVTGFCWAGPNKNELYPKD